MHHAYFPAMKLRNVANLLGSLAVLITDEMSEAVSREHSPAECAAILVLDKYPGASIEELRGPLALSHSGCVRLVDRLEGEGYVERRAGTDARAVAISLTRKGRDAAAHARARREEVLLSAVSTLTRDEQEILGDLVTKLLDRKVVVPRVAMRTCRLCDYVACVSCPMHKFAAEGDLES
jgi:MarR family transcriptional repressor of emrRAB